MLLIEFAAFSYFRVEEAHNSSNAGNYIPLLETALSCARFYPPLLSSPYLYFFGNCAELHATPKTGEIALDAAPELSFPLCVK